MKPAAFQYHRPNTVDETLSLLKECGEDGKVLAGGQSLMPLMNFRLAQPAHLIDINFIEGLDYVRRENDALKIGCLARQSRLLGDSLVRQRCPLLADALAYVGHEQTRNRGTFCGSLAHADPAAELPAVLLALDGSVTVGNSTGKREIAARDFFHSYLTTALASDDMLLEASVPEQPARAGSSFVEFARRFGDFAIVGVAVVLVPDKERIADASIALTGVGDRPWRARDIEAMLVGQTGSTDLFGRIGAEVAARINPSSDIHASESYRRALASVLTRRALAEAWGRARNGN
ncbi:MAG TPA: xanthine dehydrogenase family protein subunit M [Candidatus Binatia bacterium]|nr:xanthine dehydrogenase family protein subunit M [Candidatus Binatia bacterium]